MCKGKREKNEKQSRMDNGFWGITIVCIALLMSALFGRRYTEERVAEERAPAWQAVGNHMDSVAIQEWLARREGQLHRLPELGIVTPDSSETFSISLSDEKGGSGFERMWGEHLKVAGRWDSKRGYFEGEVIWDGQEICILDFNSMKYAVLKENIRSFVMGDYYISYEYEEDKGVLELLIFYCPA